MIELQGPSWDPYHKDVLDELGSTYRGRRLIVRDTPIDGGVLYYNVGEAVTVDGLQGSYADQYELLYRLTKQNATWGGLVWKDSLGRAAATSVMQMMEYSEGMVDAMVSRQTFEQGYSQGTKGVEIDLGFFLKYGYGTCRHLATAAGWVLERFMQGDLSDNQPSIDASDIVQRGAHAWLRDAPQNPSSAFDITIVDCANSK